MWATVVNRDGVVCAVVFSGTNRGAQWPGSRVISAQKANTANAFSLDAARRATDRDRPRVWRSRPPTSIRRCSRAAASTGCSTATRWTPTRPTRRAAPPHSGRRSTDGQPRDRRRERLRRRARALRQRRPARRRRRRQRRHVVRRPLHRLARAAGAEPRLPRRGRRRQRRRDAPGQHRVRHHRQPGWRKGISTGGFGHPKCINTGDSRRCPSSAEPDAAGWRCPSRSPLRSR